MCLIVIGYTGKRHSEFTLQNNFIQLIRHRIFTKTSHLTVSVWSWRRFRNCIYWNGNTFFFQFFIFIYNYQDYNCMQFFTLSSKEYDWLVWIQQNVSIHVTVGPMSVDISTKRANFGIFWPSLSTTFSIGFNSLSSSGITLSAMCLIMYPSLFT